MEIIANTSSVKKAMSLIQELHELCELSDINYCFFLKTQKGVMTGASKLSLEDATIVMENLVHPLSIKETEFVVHILNLLKQEKK